METNRAKKAELKFDLRVLPPPTVPVVSWAEARADYKRGPVVTGPDDVAAYFKQYIGGKTKEAFLTLYLDHRNHVLDCVCNQEGTVDHTFSSRRRGFEAKTTSSRNFRECHTFRWPSGRH